MRRPSFLTPSLSAFFLLVSCVPAARPVAVPDSAQPVAGFATRVAEAAAAAGIPADLAEALKTAAMQDGAALEAEIAAALSGDSALTILVDKRRILSADYEPRNLADLGELAARSGNAFKANRAGLKLRAEAAEALVRMGEAARADGITLLVSSAYRSYAYQEQVYARVVAELGQEAADRESARPGRSQHQLGLAADFGSIDDSFAETKAGKWLAANAGRFGWSLSFPRGYESVTGYRWESWHYRYVGTAAASLIEKRFGGIQQYCLEFFAAWKKPLPIATE